MKFFYNFKNLPEFLNQITEISIHFREFIQFGEKLTNFTESLIQIYREFNLVLGTLPQIHRTQSQSSTLFTKKPTKSQIINPILHKNKEFKPNNRQLNLYRMEPNQTTEDSTKLTENSIKFTQH